MAQRTRRSSFFAETKGNGEENLHFDNSGRHDLFVPGFGLPVPIERPGRQHERFAHGFGDWAQNRLTAREIVMLRLMNTITDRPQWHLKIQDSATVAKWAGEARSDMISQAAWDWCLSELRDKAIQYSETSLTHVFDSSSRICKSDALITTELLEKIANQVQALERTGELVDPDLYPLVFGESRVLIDGGRVGIVGAIDNMGQGDVCQHQIWKCPREARIRCDGYVRTRPGDSGPCSRCGATRNSLERSWELRGYRYSSRYQWLPCEVEFGSVDESTIETRITSYINNLHPRQNASLYKSIEEFIRLSIQPWNEVLVWRDRGRTPERIRTFGVEWSPNPPEQQYLDIENMDENAKQQIERLLEQDENPLAPAANWRYPSIDADWRIKYTLPEALDLKYHRVKRWLHPEPGSSFTYNDWKLGKNNKAIVPGRKMVKREMNLPVPPKDDHVFYNVTLERDFANKGLQVVVEIGSVELNPENPNQEATSWQLSGLPNERIVATTVVYFATENMTEASGSLSFRVEADLDPVKHRWGTDTGSNPHHPLAPLADIYGFESIRQLCSDNDIPGDYAVQVLGTVQTPDGRLLAFPNVLQHRTEAFELLDSSKPGRRRFLKFYLVDPHYRICSTRNTPPQQHDWWAGAGMARIPWQRHSFPVELVYNIENLVGDFPIGKEEAKKRAEEFRKERLDKQSRIFDEETHHYYFGDWAALGGGAPRGVHI